MCELISTNESFETLGVPCAWSNAPLASAEFAQPWPAAPLFPHGHAVPVPSPKQ